MNQVFINGVQHAWASVKVNFLGRTLTGITSISFGDKKTKENLYGAGDEPIGRGHGNREYETVAMELYQFEVEALQAISGGDITVIPPFEIVVSFKPTIDAAAKTYIIQNCEFTNNKFDLKQGDTKSIIKFDLICAGIKYHSTN